jgi:SAM-dependent methyltransferase
MSYLYDSIGVGYASFRRPDHRIRSAILHALGDALTVLNVGAGTGSYEPTDRTVVAVEISKTMIQQRPIGSARAIQASAVALPFRDKSFEAGMAILTIHHWPDHSQGLCELVRVVRGHIAIVTWDPESQGFWLTEDYFPDILSNDRNIFPSIDDLRCILGAVEVHPLLIPYDCTDSFLGAYWRKPEAYLDPQVRQMISSFSKIKGVDQGLTRLRRDLADGSWKERHGKVLEQAELDIGYRLVIRKRCSM